MSETERIIRGVPALTLLVSVGVAALAIAGTRLAHGDPPAAGAAFVAGMAWGFLGALGLRIGRTLGPARLQDNAGLRWGLLALSLVPPALAPFVALVVPLRVAQGFVTGVASMLFLGMALIEDGPRSSIAAIRPLRGLVAGVFSVVVGAAFLGFEGYRFAQGDQAVVPFIVGVTCGYIGLLVIRIADLRGRGDLTARGPRGWAIRGMALVPIWSPLLALLLLSSRAAQGFIFGSLGMLCFGQVLLGQAWKEAGSSGLRSDTPG